MNREGGVGAGLPAISAAAIAGKPAPTDAALTVAAALEEARAAIPLPEARLLLQHALGVAPTALAVHPERALSPEQTQRFRASVARRAAGEPIAYLTGRREFYGLDFRVGPAVLIPRPETELLVEAGLEKLAGAGGRILDLGTGSGCVAIALAKALPHAQVTAVDASAAALELARANAQRHGVAVRFLCGDWFGPVGEERFELIVANPPYVAEADPHLGEGDLRFEPRGALAAGPDGLAALRRIVAAAPEHLAPGGWLYCEHGYDQAPAVAALLAQAGFRVIEHRNDLAGIPRVSGGALTPAVGPL